MELILPSGGNPGSGDFETLAALQGNQATILSADLNHFFFQGPRPVRLGTVDRHLGPHPAQRLRLRRQLPARLAPHLQDDDVLRRRRVQGRNLMQSKSRITNFKILQPMNFYLRRSEAGSFNVIVSLEALLTTNQNGQYFGSESRNS